MDRIKETELVYHNRPAVKAESQPFSTLGAVDLLALVIGGGFSSSDASALLTHIPLKQLFNASLFELQQVIGIGPTTAKRIKAALELGRRSLRSRDQLRITSPGEVANFLQSYGLDQKEQEELWVICLDTKGCIFHWEMVYRGTLNEAHVRVAEILRPAIRHNANCILLAHNHPSGDPTPSPEDVEVTRAIVWAGKLMGIQLLDHIILGHGRYVSLKDKGLGDFDG